MWTVPADNAQHSWHTVPLFWSWRSCGRFYGQTKCHRSAFHYYYSLCRCHFYLLIRVSNCCCCLLSVLSLCALSLFVNSSWFGLFISVLLRRHWKKDRNWFTKNTDQYVQHQQLHTFMADCWKGYISSVHTKSGQKKNEKPKISRHMHTDTRWLKRSRTQGNAIPLPTGNGSRRSHIRFFCGRMGMVGERYGELMSADCITNPTL